MKRNLTTRSTLGGTAKMLRGLMNEQPRPTISAARVRTLIDAMFQHPTGLCGEPKASAFKLVIAILREAGVTVEGEIMSDKLFLTGAGAAAMAGVELERRKNELEITRLRAELAAANERLAAAEKALLDTAGDDCPFPLDADDPSIKACLASGKCGCYWAKCQAMKTAIDAAKAREG